MSAAWGSTAEKDSLVKQWRMWRMWTYTAVGSLFYLFLTRGF